MGSREVLSEIISVIVGSFSPMYKELTMLYSVFDPVKPHIHCFGSTLFNSVVADAGSASVVGLNWSCGLWMAHLVEGGAQSACFLGVEEEGS